jgi:hypothetical protein
MAEATAQQFDASIAPIANVTIYGQLGSQIQGSGTETFYTNGALLWLYFAQAGTSTVSYGVDNQFPGTPLQPFVWTQIPNTSNVNIAYKSPPGSDLKVMFGW